ncbi:DUF1634 domain-containing protein [Holzapfeliella sp. He02]|jgi:uncharacterized membrane protein|uniref:DUF1634 domain-containing protein n=1 Tax=Holzapfeliella saturejae TaxID=3082953 RepID=A0ABU8SEK6_9LACO
MNDKQKEMQDVELVIGKILRIGVIIAAVVMALGVLLLLVQGNSGYADNNMPATLSEVFMGSFALKPYAVMALGILLLILTPVLRVVISIYAFFKESDYLYMWITTIVFVILIISMIVGYLGK